MEKTIDLANSKIISVDLNDFVLEIFKIQGKFTKLKIRHNNDCIEVYDRSEVLFHSLNNKCNSDCQIIELINQYGNVYNIPYAQTKDFMYLVQIIQQKNNDIEEFLNQYNKDVLSDIIRNEYNKKMDNLYEKGLHRRLI